jgi:hypothetical protein
MYLSISQAVRFHVMLSIMVKKLRSRCFDFRAVIPGQPTANRFKDNLVCQHVTQEGNKYQMPELNTGSKENNESND